MVIQSIVDREPSSMLEITADDLLAVIVVYLTTTPISIAA